MFELSIKYNVPIQTLNLNSVNIYMYIILILFSIYLKFHI